MTSLCRHLSAQEIICKLGHDCRQVSLHRRRDRRRDATRQFRVRFSNRGNTVNLKQESRAVAGKSRDAAVNFDTHLDKSAASVAWVHN